MGDERKTERSEVSGFGASGRQPSGADQNARSAMSQASSRTQMSSRSQVGERVGEERKTERSEVEGCGASGMGGVMPSSRDLSGRSVTSKKGLSKSQSIAPGVPDTPPLTTSAYSMNFGVSRKVTIKAAEMEDKMQVDAVRAADEAMNETSVEQDVARRIKLGFDNKYQPPWHCVVGRKFGSYVTHEAGYFIYFYLGNHAVLLFKAKD